MTKHKKKIVLLQHYFNEIGGIETFLINFCKKFGQDYEISLITREISFENAILFEPYANVICDFTEKIKCDILIITSVLVDEEFYRMIEYSEIYQMIHSDWSAMKKFWQWSFKEYDSNTKYIAVSENARASFKAEYHRDSIVIPNILCESEKKLRLLSCTRLSEEKGYNRMCQLCDLFKKYKVDYSWDVYGTNPSKYPNYDNMILYPPLKNARQIMKNYDYVVQLSDTEAFCYTMYESLMEGVPVLVTPFPTALKEIEEGINGYIIPYDVKLTSKEVKNIFKNIPKNISYKQEGVFEQWKKILK